MTDLDFTSYAFPATDAPTSRTMPLRYNDIINVKDWGAIGDGVANDSSAIQAAIDYAMALHADPSEGAIVFFPKGTYIIATPPLVIGRVRTFGNARGGLRLLGAGRDAAIIKGTYSGGGSLGGQPYKPFLLQKNPSDFQSDNIQSIEDLTIENDSTVTGSGAVVLHIGNPQAFHAINCHFIGDHAFAFGDTFGTSLRNCIFTNPTALLSADADPNANNYPTKNVTTEVLTGSVGCILFQTLVMNCQAIGFDTGFAVGGPGNAIISCYASRCKYGVYLGAVSGYGVGHGSATGTQILACQFDRCRKGIYQETGGGTYVAANVISGTTGPTDPAQIQSITWAATAGGTATVTTLLPHNIGAGAVLPMNIVTNPGGWTPDGSGNQNVTITRTTTTQFTYPLAVDPSSTPFTSGTWNWPIQRAIVVKTSMEATFAANVLSAQASVGSFDNENFTDLIGPNSGTVVDNVCMSMRMPYGYVPIPNGIQGVHETDFIQCGMPGSSPAGPPVAFMQYRDLGGHEGSEYTIIDAKPQSSFAGFVTGGGSSHCKVRHDGRKWCRVG
jgi:hypothetical protein